MSDTNESILSGHPAFKGLSSNALERTCRQSTNRLFRLGQSLCHGNIIPAEVLLIHSGSARLLVLNEDVPSTAETLDAGSFVGLASLLRVYPCEEVAAKSELEALAIPDSIVLELLKEEPGFKDWCSNHLFSAEKLALLQQLLQQRAWAGPSLLATWPAFRSQVRLVGPELPIATNLSSDSILFAASHNIVAHPIGCQLDPCSGLPVSQGPLPPRLITLPRQVLFDLLTPPSGFEIDDFKSAGQSVSKVPVLEAGEPVASALNLGEHDRPELLLVRGNGAIDEALACFQMLAAQLKLPFRRDSIEKSLRDALRRGQALNLQDCGNIAATMGLHVTGVEVTPIQANRLQVPALTTWKDGFAVVRAADSQGILLASPKDGWVELSLSKIHSAFPDGVKALLLERSNTSLQQRFGFGWFRPSLLRYRSILVQVLVASFVVQFLSLANPLLIQVIVDKVISQRSLDTLQVLGIALVVVTLLEGAIGSLRTFLFTETTNRIDLRLGSEVIDHLLRLPLAYFDRRSVGELETRVAELETIRNFLTGHGLTTLLDTIFSIIYIGVMLLYSWVLTLVALSVLPIQIGLTVLGAPLFRRQYREAAHENARTQSHLVEVLTGIQTVKAQNVEMVSRWKWQDRYNKYISRSYEKTVTGTAYYEASQVLQKLSQLLVLWVGASLVLKGEITLGQLIAFRIISQYATDPLLRLSMIWQDIQELKVSFERLADVVDTPEESDNIDKQKISLPAIQGEVIFQNICFSFDASEPQVLSNVDLKISAGTFVGVVGQSGSGKSTLMKLLARLYAPTSGRILIDHYDIDKVELFPWRRQVGIVPQDPLLFSGTISENISLTDPDASSDSIIAAAKLACAHEFIMDMPGGYSAHLGERGIGLSGGQRQRVALARTLLTNPKLLVLDEATSSLDYSTESRVCENLLHSQRGNTVFFVTHRLSTIRRANLIVMLHEGSIAEVGTHDELMGLRGRYFALYRQQGSN